MIQFASQGFKKGEPPSHQQSVAFVKNFCCVWMDKIVPGADMMLIELHLPWRVVFPYDFRAKHKLKYNKHDYDIGFSSRYNPILVIEIGAIGDDTRHSKIQQRINDGVAFDYLDEYYPHCRKYRFHKYDAMDENWLKKELFQEIK